MPENLYFCQECCLPSDKLLWCMKGIDFEVLRFSVENSVEKLESLRRFREGTAPQKGFTRGLYYRGVE